MDVPMAQWLKTIDIYYLHLQGSGIQAGSLLRVSRGHREDASCPAPLAGAQGALLCSSDCWQNSVPGFVELRFSFSDWLPARGCSQLQEVPRAPWPQVLSLLKSLFLQKGRAQSSVRPSWLNSLSLISKSTDGQPHHESDGVVFPGEGKEVCDNTVSFL